MTRTTMGADELVGALLRGGLSAAAVAALLLAGQRWGRDVAGVLAGLPTVTGPALVWMALDQGGDFASQAAVGAVLAGAACAVFALAYARASMAMGRWSALAVASLASVPALGLLWLPQLLQVLPALHTPRAVLALAFGLVAAVCLVCLRALPQVPALRPDGLAAGASARSSLTTIVAAGAVSTLASLLAPHLSPMAAGAMTSPPLLAAAVVWELHRQRCCASVLVFLRGYTAGLVGRCGCVAAFAALLPTGLVQAVAAGSVVMLALAWVTARRIASRADADTSSSADERLSEATSAMPVPAP